MNATLTGSRAIQMIEQEHEQERAKLGDAHGDRSREIAAKRDQALAILFYRSGWSEERLAKKEDSTHQWVSDRMRFGRFLNFVNSLVEPHPLPKNLSAKK